MDTPIRRSHALVLSVLLGIGAALSIAGAVKADPYNCDPSTEYCPNCSSTDQTYDPSCDECYYDPCYYDPGCDPDECQPGYCGEYECPDECGYEDCYPPEDPDCCDIATPPGVPDVPHVPNAVVLVESRVYAEEWALTHGVHTPDALAALARELASAQ